MHWKNATRLTLVCCALSLTLSLFTLAITAPRPAIQANPIVVSGDPICDHECRLCGAIGEALEGPTEKCKSRHACRKCKAVFRPYWIVVTENDGPAWAGVARTKAE